MKATYIAHMGTDLTVVNAARISFTQDSKELNERDKSLIQYLARGCQSKDWAHMQALLAESTFMDLDDIESLMYYIKSMPTHWTPFSHPMITVRETVPLIVVRQRYKHMVGFTYNEESRRYKSDTPEFFFPPEWRSAPEGSIKQGSGGTHPRSDYWKMRHEQHMSLCEDLYEEMIDDGIAPEMARMELPQSTLVSYWATGSLYAWFNAFNQRVDAHAQEEIQVLAAQWKSIIEPLYPVSWQALTNGK